MFGFLSKISSRLNNYPTTDQVSQVDEKKTKPAILQLAAILLAGALLTPSVTLAAFGFKLDGSLDKEAISQAYFEGEFSRILPPLETYRQSFPESATKDDSIFVYKYLSVIYAADSSTRKKGESCMVQLIKMKPAIELLDLYISDNIAAIFKNVKQNYFEQQKYVREHDFLGNEKAVPKTNSAAQRYSNNWIWWTIGGVGSAAIVTTAYFVLTSDNGSANHSSDIKP